VHLTGACRTCAKQARALAAAARNADWQQVALNGGPPCFALEPAGHFCLRAERWAGHPEMHPFVSLAALLSAYDSARKER
jgi:hypothetical protein